MPVAQIFYCAPRVGIQYKSRFIPILYFWYLLFPHFALSQTWAEKTLNSLNLRQKIAQLFIVATVSNHNQPTPALVNSLNACPYPVDPAYIETLVTEYGVGGIIFLYKSDPHTQLVYTKSLQNKAAIPLLVAQDAEWGMAMRLDIKPELIVNYPRNLALGALQDISLIEQVGYAIGRDCKAIGVHLNLAPVVDVNNNPKNPIIHTRSFGDNPERVTECSLAYLKGLRSAGVMSCIKHFPGHGNTATDSHTSLPLLPFTLEQLQHTELYPFKHIISHDHPDAVMIGHLAVPALTGDDKQPATFSSLIIALLKKEYAFDGLIITDGLGMGALTQQYKPGEIELNAFLAGNDILLCAVSVPRAIDLIEKAVQEGLVAENDLNDRVLKVLRAKEQYVLPNLKLIEKPIEDILSYLTRAEAQMLQKQVYQNAITCAKGADTSVALENATLIQIGSLPQNECFNHCKAYTANHLITPLLNENDIRDCIVAAHSTEVILLIGSMHSVISKQFGITKSIQDFIALLKANQKKVHIVLFSTPYAIPHCAAADTIFIAYEECIPAQKAMASILLGTQKAQGKLPISLENDCLA